MKPRLFSIFACVLCVPALCAQEDAPIRVTSTLHADGSRTDRQMNPYEKTAIETTYDAADKLMQKVVYKIDQNGDATEGMAYDAKGKPILGLKFTVDPATRRVTERYESTPAGKLIRKLVYHYGPNGKVRKVDAYDGNGQLIPGRR